MPEFHGHNAILNREVTADDLPAPTSGAGEFYDAIEGVSRGRKREYYSLDEVPGTEPAVGDPAGHWLATAAGADDSAADESLDTIVARMEAFAARSEYTSSELDTHLADMWKSVEIQDPSLFTAFHDPAEPVDAADQLDLSDWWAPCMPQGYMVDGDQDGAGNADGAA